MTSCKRILPLIGIGMIGGLAGCGLGSLPPLTLPTQPSQPISVLFVAIPPATLAVNASATIYAAATYAIGVGGSNANEMVTYAVTCGSAGACGSFSASDELGAVVYTAPTTVPSGGTVTITATSVADTTKSVSASITIVPSIPISVAFPSATPASLQIEAVVSLRALITNDTSANPQVKWMVTCGSAGCGSFNPTTTTSEAATTYTAPSAIPTGNTVTVTATSVTDPTKSASASIIITPQAQTLANGTYVFQLSGPSEFGVNFVSGVFVAQDGAVTGGEQDFINVSDGDSGSNADTLFDSIIGGSYATTPDGNVEITLKTNDYNVGDEGVETLDGVIVSGSRVLVAEVNFFNASGTLDLQTGTKAPSGGYAISLYGEDVYDQAAGIGGIVNIDRAGAISGAGSVLDMNDAGVFRGEQSLGASTLSTPDKFGRVVFQLVPGSFSTIPSLYLAGYIVDGSHIRLVETAGDNFQGVMGGTALGQGSNTGQFTNSSIAGSSYVFGASGLEGYAPLQVAGVVSANAGGSLEGILNWNDLTRGAQSPLPVTGSWTIDSIGRATFSKLTDGSTFNYSLHFYLTGNGDGLMLSSDSTEMVTGQAFQQQAGAFSAASFSGSYGLNAAEDGVGAALAPFSNTVVGPVASVADNGADTLTGFADSGNGAADFAISGSLTAGSNGVFTGTLTGLDPASRTTANDFTFYLVDTTRAVAIETDNSQLTLGFLELQQ
jgi:hypothetical protein